MSQGKPSPRVLMSKWEEEDQSEDISMIIKQMKSAKSPSWEIMFVLKTYKSNIEINQFLIKQKRK